MENKIYFICEIDGVFYIRTPDSKEVAQVSPFKNIDQSAVYIGFDIQIPARVYDLAIVEKILYYQKSKTLNNLSKKYFHKHLPQLNTPKQNLDFIERLYKAQKKDRDKYGLFHSVNFEVRFSKYLFDINQRTVKIDSDLVNADIKKYETIYRKFSICPIKSKSDLKDYLRQKGVLQYNYTVKRDYKLKHSFLLSLKDPILNDYVLKSRATSMLTHIRPIEGLKEAKLSHKQYSTVTGRIHTYSPNLQGLNKYVVKGMELDYVAQELMIYMHYFNPPIFGVFKQHKLKDINGLLTQQMYKLTTHPDKVKALHPDKRARVKLMILQLMNGQTRMGFAYRFGYKDFERMPEYDRLMEVLDFENSLKKLLTFVATNNAFNVCPKLGKTLRSPDTINYMLARERAEGLDDKSAKNRSFITDEEEMRAEILRVSMNRFIQGTGALIQKKCVMNCEDIKDDNHISLLVHDGNFFDSDIGADQRVEAMKAAYKSVMDNEIFVEKTIESKK